MGLLGRPQIFCPMRRSILCLACARFVIVELQSRNKKRADGQTTAGLLSEPSSAGYPADRTFVSPRKTRSTGKQKRETPNAGPRWQRRVVQASRLVKWLKLLCSHKNV